MNTLNSKTHDSTVSTRFPTRLSILSLLLCGAFAGVPAWAAPTTDPAELAELAARNRQERADCLSVQEAGARADCVRDTNVAYGHQKRNRASDIDPPFAKNLTLRCDALSGDENRDCLARMDGQGTTSGSVAGGGIYRELVVFETAPALAPMATPAAAAPAESSAPNAPMAAPNAPMTPAPSTMPMSPMTSPMTTPMSPMTVTPMAPVVPAAPVQPSATNPTTPK